MRNLMLAAFVALTGCTGAAGTLVPIRAVGEVKGDSAGPQVFLAGVPMNALVRIHGEVKYTVQPMPPYVTLDGDYTIIVEPLPGQEPAVQESVQRGDLLIRRDGKPSALNAPGSIKAFKAAARELRQYSLPPPIPNPPPLPTVPPPTKQIASEAEGECHGESCSIPR